MTQKKPNVLAAIGLAESGEERIFNGRKARLGQFPYQVLLLIPKSDGVFICGGSIISEEWIITAAHCTHGAQNATVHMGIVDRTSQDGVTMASSEIYNHPNYKNQEYEDDIGFIKLPESLTFNENINKIALPTKADAAVDTFVNQTATTSGWGLRYDYQFFSTRFLQYTRVIVDDQESCVDVYGDLVGDKELCTSKLKTLSGPCSGDSGGPLSVERDGAPVLIGLTAWGEDACVTLTPNVYTNVAAYLDFLTETTGIATE